MRSSVWFNASYTQKVPGSKAQSQRISYLIKVEYQVELAYVLECTIERFHKNLRIRQRNKSCLLGLIDEVQ
jgi:hypothetical protein